MSAMNQVLVVEDEEVIRNSLRRLLERHNYRVSEAGTVAESLENFDMEHFDVIISDLRLPGAPGTDIIKATSAPVVIMTSYSSIRSAIDSIQLGAVDYIAKPFEHNEIIETVSKVIEEHGRQAGQAGQEGQEGQGEQGEQARQARQARQGERASQEGKGGQAAQGKQVSTAISDRPSAAFELEPPGYESPTQGMIGSCPPMQELFRRIRKVALTDSTVLVNGESGTGKELVARAIHRLSSRNGGEMISVNCAAIPENLIESELFGHEKGAFTGATATRTGLVEAANKSTLFLDEIGELPLEAQSRLLRVLQENEIRMVGSVQSKKVDVRLIVATHRDLKQLVADGQFREDLFYRINVMALLIPPLRERGNDILKLANVILQQTCHRLKTQELNFTTGASEAIIEYAWPGNVRELENAIERAVVLAESSEISEELLAIDLGGRRLPGVAIDSAFGNSDGAPPLVSEPKEELSLEDYFQRFVLEHQDTMNETQLAKSLGISRKCLWERRQRMGISRRKKAADQ